MLNEEIKNLRKNLGLTQEEFARELGVVQRTVSSWETGENEPTVSTLVTIFQKFNVTPNQLIFGNNNLFSALLRAYDIAKKDKAESELINIANTFIFQHSIDELGKMIRSFKGNTFTQKLGEAWSGSGERMLIVLYYFIEYIQSQNFEKFDKSTFVATITSFNIPKKIRTKHLFTIKEKDKLNLIEWVNQNLDDLDAATLLVDLPKTKEFIKSELNYINRFLV